MDTTVMSSNGVKPSRTERRINALEEKLDTVMWLHAELSYALRHAAAAQLAQKLQPQIQEEIMRRMASG